MRSTCSHHFILLDFITLISGQHKNQEASSYVTSSNFLAPSTRTGPTSTACSSPGSTVQQSEEKKSALKLIKDPSIFNLIHKQLEKSGKTRCKIQAMILPSKVDLKKAPDD